MLNGKEGMPQMRVDGQRKRREGGREALRARGPRRSRWRRLRRRWGAGGRLASVEISGVCVGSNKRRPFRFPIRCACMCIACRCAKHYGAAGPWLSEAGSRSWKTLGGRAIPPRPENMASITAYASRVSGWVHQGISRDPLRMQRAASAIS